MAEDINLSNFEEVRFQKSKYILTSPRSLRACANVGIKPVELLPQTFSQFITSNCGICSIGLKSCNLSVLYKEYERQRRAKLWKARRERQRIIESQSTKTKTRKVAIVGSPPPPPFPVSTIHASSPLLTISKRSPTIPLKDQRILDAMLRKRQHELELWSSTGTEDSKLKLERASLNKEMIDEIKRLSVKVNNYDKEKRFQRNKSFLEEEKRQNEEYTKELAKHKDEEIDIRLRQRNSLREEEGIWKKKKKELKEKQIKLAVEDLTAELEEWRQNVNEINKTNMSRALDTSQRLLHEKKCLLQQKTKEKEIIHRQAMTRLQQDEERTREYNIKELNQKNERIDNLLRQRAEQSFQALKTSHYTAQLRESIKDSTGLLSDSFKQKIIHAQQRVTLENRMTEKRDRERHGSSVTFG